MKCQLCEKQPRVQTTRKKLRGHYNPTAKKWKHPNLQKTVLPDGQKVLACNRCRKKLYKTARVR